MKSFFAILVFFGLYTHQVSAQSSNRMKVIAMIMSQPKVKLNGDIFSSTNHSYIPAISAPTAPLGFRSSGTIPKYTLAKGAVICRLEEYVQLHSPFKLNIGVGGE